MLTPDGTVKVLDLGLALLRSEPTARHAEVATEQPVAAASEEGQESGVSRREITGERQAMGTADYMAPEQVADSHSVDIRADIYALGCTLYRLLAGRPPFSGPQYRHAVAKMMGHIEEPVPPIRTHRDDIPEPLAAALDRMLAKARNDRFARPVEVVDALHPFTDDADLRRLYRLAQKRADPASEDVESLISTNRRRSRTQSGSGRLLGRISLQVRSKAGSSCFVQVVLSLLVLIAGTIAAQ